MTAHPIDTEALRRLADAATPGPWEADTDRYTGSAVVTPDDSPITWDESEGEVFTVADAEFIAAARTAVPQLLDQLDRAEARIKAVADICDLSAEDAEDMDAISAHYASGYEIALQDIRRALDGGS